MRAFFKERVSAWPRSPFARVVLRRLIVGAIPVMFATSAAAVPVTFDLTSNAGFIYFDSGKTLTSDLGTTAIMRAFGAGGTQQSTGTQDIYGAGTARAPNVAVAVFGCLEDGGTSDCSALRFFFPTEVTLLSIAVSVLGDDEGMRVFAGGALLGSVTFQGKYPDPPVRVFDYDPSNPDNLADELTIQARLGSSFSIRSITVDDPSAVAVPEPATSLLLLAGLGCAGIATARRRKLAA